MNNGKVLDRAKLMFKDSCYSHMIYAFLIFFASIGLYYIVKGIRLRINLDPNCDDYINQRKKSTEYIIGGILLILIGGFKFYTRYFLWGWR